MPYKAFTVSREAGNRRASNTSSGRSQSEEHKGSSCEPSITGRDSTQQLPRLHQYTNRENTHLLRRCRQHGISTAPRSSITERDNAIHRTTTRPNFGTRRSTHVVAVQQRPVSFLSGVTLNIVMCILTTL